MIRLICFFVAPSVRSCPKDQLYQGKKERETSEKEQETPHALFACGYEFASRQEKEHTDLYLARFERDDACGDFLPAVLS